ncbi:TIGR03773 family transporter-associated surface protein [Streptomyces sp. NPDC093065]|uniref:TIGR03773 family transporter-associated surface protein n=1 Tax=Streptomyces sp. NPDC093065 TaxID=3366021 RepID=UPI0037F84B0E
MAVVGSLALAAGVAPAATAASPEIGSGSSPVSTSADVVMALDGDRLTLDLGQPGVGDRADAEAGSGSRAAVPAGGHHGAEGGTDTAAAVPRWDTTQVPVGSVQDGTVTWALTEAHGPGHVTVFEPEPETASASPGPDAHVLFDSRDGLPDTQELAAGDTGAAVWAFTEPGEYTITSQATARLTSGAVTTATSEWTVTVPAGEPRPTKSPEASSAPSASPGDPRKSARPTLAAPETAASKSVAKAAKADISTERVVIADGHVDAVAGKMVNGTLRTLFKDSRDPSQIVWREPSSVVLHVNPQAKQKVPQDGAYAFLGEAGSSFWLIPQVQQQGVVWAGWNTEDLTGDDLKGPIDMTLTNVSGPGTLAIWETAGLGAPDVLYDSRDGLPDGQKVNLGVHAHANWAFSKEGTYKVTFRLSGTLASGGTASDTRTYTFAVGDVDPGTVTPGGGGTDGGATASTGGGGTSTGGGGDTAPSAGPDSEPGATEGSLAHTGTGGALPLAVGAGALVVAGVAATGLVARRRRAAAPGGAGS